MASIYICNRSQFFWNPNDLNYFDFSMIDENIFLIRFPFFKIIRIPIF